MAESKYLGLPHQSIIKPWVNAASKESGLNSDDDSEFLGSTGRGLDASTQTLSLFCTYDPTRRTPYKPSVGHLIGPSASTPSLVLVNQYEPPIYSESFPQVRSKTPIALRPSLSTGDLGSRKLKRRTTSDSGIDDDHPSATPLQKVTIYGLDREAYIANRYDFDSSKIDEYRHRQHNQPLLAASPKAKSSHSSKFSGISVGSSAKPSKIRASLTRLFKGR